jgi:hypothetical protein
MSEEARATALFENWCFPVSNIRRREISLYMETITLVEFTRRSILYTVSDIAFKGFAIVENILEKYKFITSKLAVERGSLWNSPFRNILVCPAIHCKLS